TGTSAGTVTLNLSGTGGWLGSGFLVLGSSCGGGGGRRSPLKRCCAKQKCFDPSKVGPLALPPAGRAGLRARPRGHPPPGPAGGAEGRSAPPRAGPTAARQPGPPTGGRQTGNRRRPRALPAGETSVKVGVGSWDRSFRA